MLRFGRRCRADGRRAGVIAFGCSVGQGLTGFFDAGVGVAGRGSLEIMLGNRRRSARARSASVRWAAALIRFAGQDPHL